MRTLKLAGEEVAEISTRAPYKLHLYSRALAMSLGLTVRGLYGDAVKAFLEAKPWERGFKWRITQAPVRSNRIAGSDGSLVGAKEPTDWLQVNMRLPLGVAQELDMVAHTQNVSLSAAAYSALFWYCWFIYPPQNEAERRKSKGG